MPKVQKSNLNLRVRVSGCQAINTTDEFWPCILPFCPNCGKSVAEGTIFCAHCGHKLTGGEEPKPVVVQPKPVERKSHRGRNIAIGVVGLVILLIVGVSFGLQVFQRAAIQNIKVESASPSNISPHLSGVSLDVQMKVRNPNSITATLDTISYSIYANGNYLGSGQTTATYNLPPNSDYTLTFPVSMAWGSVFRTVGSYILNGGHATWEIKGVDNVNINGIAFSVPFDYTTSGQYTGGSSTQQSTTSIQQTTTATTVTPAGYVIANGEYNVGPGKQVMFPFQLASQAQVTGTFSATASLGNNIIVIIKDQGGNVYYNSGKVASGTIAVTLGGGSYYLVLDNTYSTFSTKDVTIQASFTYT